MALLAAELASVHAVYCVRCGTTIVQPTPTPPVQRACTAPYGDARSSMSAATAMNTLGIAAFGT